MNPDSNEFLKELQEDPITYINEHGEKQILHMHEEVFAALTKDYRQRGSFIGAVHSLNYYEYLMKNAIASGDTRATLEAKEKYSLAVKKVFSLTAGTRETIHIKQLIYGTERYQILSENEVVQCIQQYFLSEQLHSLQPIILTKVTDIINKRRKELHATDGYIRLHIDQENSVLGYGDLFDETNPDTIELLEMMKQRESLIQKLHFDIDDAQATAHIEFNIWLLSNFPCFTYDLQKCINHAMDPEKHFFYIGKDRDIQINKRRIY